MGEKLAQFVNKSLSGYSMYNGTLFGIASIWAAALVFSFIGLIPYDPLAMGASLAVLAVSTGLSSWLTGALFGVRAHGVSSLITGIILALIFTPTLDPAKLMILALAGLIAGASKYVLTYKNRHIFNPAAIAALLIGVTGLAAASWWVATPPLTIFVLGVLVISLYKTKNYAISLTFLAVAVPLLLIYFAANGFNVVASLPLLMSWPLLFLAGVMLTEPLTLPPRKWQMYVEAVIVAIIFALPFSVGWFSTSPEFALVIGNVFAAIVAGRYSLTLKLKERRALSPTTEEFVFASSVPMKFEAGQFAELNLPLGKQDLRGSRRSFSLTSVPGASEASFGIKFYSPSSTFKQELQKLTPGALVPVSNLSGDFVLPKDTSSKVLLVAGGIGVTPFISHLKTVAARKEMRDIVLVYSASNGEEVAYVSELEEAGAQVVVVSPTKPTRLPDGWTYVKANRLTEEILREAVADVSSRVSYVSGPPLFVGALKKGLKKLGARKVKTDYFVGY